MIIYELLYIVACVIMAKINQVHIKQDKTIHHWMNGLIHITFASIAAFLFWWGCFFIILLNARTFFDGFLSYFRFGRFNYVSLKPKSWVDRLEKSVFGMDGYTPKIIYIFISVVLNLIYLL